MKLFTILLVTIKDIIHNTSMGKRSKKSDSACFTNSENYKKDEKGNSEMDGVRGGSTSSTSYISLRHSMVLQKEAAGEKKLYEFYTACVCMPHVLRVWGLAGG